MAKKIVYSMIDSGIDGRDIPRTLYSSFDEAALKKRRTNNDPSAPYRMLKEEIIDVDKTKRQALAKLDGIDRLVLGLPDWLDLK